MSLNISTKIEKRKTAPSLNFIGSNSISFPSSFYYRNSVFSKEIESNQVNPFIKTRNKNIKNVIDIHTTYAMPSGTVSAGTETSNSTTGTYELLTEQIKKLFKTLSANMIKFLGDYTFIYKIQSMNVEEIDLVFRKFNIYPLTVDEVLGFIKRDYNDENITPEEFLGETGLLPDIIQHKYAKIAWERFKMDSTSRFIIGDSFSELLKAIIIIGSTITGYELTEEQKTNIQLSINRLIDIYGDVDYCINKLNEYSAGLLNTMTDYKTIKTQVLTANTIDDIWK